MTSWDDAAPTFDEAPDHGLRDPAVRAAWGALLAAHLPTPPARVADLGCGTGSLTALLASAGHAVTGVDLSRPMLAAAAAKASAAGTPVTLVQGDAAAPPLPPAAFDVVLARHVLWVFDDPLAVLERWVALLAPGGRLVLVEGRWWSGGGVAADTVADLVRRVRGEAVVTPLTDPQLWGGPVRDERYLLVSLR